jgi:hypothetical protein
MTSLGRRREGISRIKRLEEFATLTLRRRVVGRVAPVFDAGCVLYFRSELGVFADFRILY